MLASLVVRHFELPPGFDNIIAVELEKILLYETGDRYEQQNFKCSNAGKEIFNRLIFPNGRLT